MYIYVYVYIYVDTNTNSNTNTGILHGKVMASLPLMQKGLLLVAMGQDWVEIDFREFVLNAF